MPKRAQQDIRRRIEASGGADNLDRLCLDGIPIGGFTMGIRRLLEGCPKLEYLTLNDCELRSLEGFPQLQRLIGLELADNQITDHDLPHLSAVPQVNFLTLGNNRLSSPSSLKQLLCLSELEILQLQENQCCQVEDYRQEIFAALPSVKVVDRIDRNGKETEEENPSEYISNLGNSRLDLLELLEDADREEEIPKAKAQKEQGEKQDIFRTAATYADSGLRSRKNSLQQAIAANPNHFSIFHPTSSHYRSSTPQKGFRFMRAESFTNSDSQSENGLINCFKRKLHKKQ